MQKKKSIKSRAIDIIIVLLCLTGSVMSGITFWREYNLTLTKLNEDPIASISYKKRIVQRKFTDRIVWDTLKNTSPVYNGDIIRTIDYSEVVIAFKDNITNIILYENSLIQVFYSEAEGAKIEFTDGQLEIDSGSKSVTVVTAAKGTAYAEIIIEGHAELNKNNDGFSLSVLEGEAVFDGEKVQSGDAVILNTEGEREVFPFITMIQSGSSLRILNTPEGIIPVEFAWNTANFESDYFVIVDIALDKDFTRIVESRNVINASVISIPMLNGSYWWRAYPAKMRETSGQIRYERTQPANKLHPSGTLEIIPVTSINLVTPVMAAQLDIQEETVSFSWTSVQGAQAYLLEISAFANMGNPNVTRQIEETSVTHTGLESGRWYWRVTPVFLNRVIGLQAQEASQKFPPSSIGNFSLERKPASVTAQEVVEQSVKSQITEENPALIEKSPAPVVIDRVPESLPENMRQLEVIRAPEIPIVSYSAGWRSDVHAENETLKAGTTAYYQIRKEIIDGQEKDVFVLSVNYAISLGNEWKQGGFYSSNNGIRQRLKDGEGVRFNVLGDAGDGWLFMIKIDSDTYYHASINIRNGQIVNNLILFSNMQHADWSENKPLDPDRITEISFIRNSLYSINSTFNSTIKIFDFEY